jgi:hypothetical protein
MAPTAQTSLPAFGPSTVFVARDFKLTLRARRRVGNAANLIEVSEDKTGRYPVTANVVNRK